MSSASIHVRAQISESEYQRLRKRAISERVPLPELVGRYLRAGLRSSTPTTTKGQ